MDWRTIKIGDHTIGDGEPCFITFEAGPTHDGVACAKRLVGLAAAAGANAIKFQIVDPDRLVADRNQLIRYEILADRETGRTEFVEEPLYDLLCRRALGREDWIAIKELADSLCMAFFATVGFEDEIAFIESLGCDSIKIASSDVNHWPLIRCAARTGICIQLDTGNSTLGEIEEAVDIIRSEGNERIIIHQCPSGYPARLESVNLRIISTLKAMFPYPVAYSDHVPGWDMDVAAVALGANLLEKTISEDRTTPSIEHIMSLEPSDMKAFTQAIRNVETAMGNSRRILGPMERKAREAYRRSVFLTEPVKAGQQLSSASIVFRRPAGGLPPSDFETAGTKIFRTDLPAGSMVRSEDLD